jgi:hypothetical protein
MIEIIGASNLTVKQVNELMKQRELEELRQIRKEKIMKLNENKRNKGSKLIKH